MKKGVILMFIMVEVQDIFYGSENSPLIKKSK
jgi:hypothetical protein